MTFDIAKARAELKQLLCQNSIRTGFVELSNGGSSSYYVDTRAVTLSSRGFMLTGALMLAKIQEIGIQRPALVGIETAVAPLVLSTMAAMHLMPSLGNVQSCFLLRRKRGDRSAWQVACGPRLPRGSEIVLVDDVSTDGEPLVKMMYYAREHGFIVRGVVCMVDRKEGAARAITPYRLSSLFVIDELLSPQTT